MGNSQIKYRKSVSEDVVSQTVPGDVISQTVPGVVVSQTISNDTSVEPGSSSKYINYEQMDVSNKKMMDVWASKGPEAMIDTITEEMKDKKMSYAEMRYKYG